MELSYCRDEKSRINIVQSQDQGTQNKFYVGFMQISCQNSLVTFKDGVLLQKC